MTDWLKPVTLILAVVCPRCGRLYKAHTYESEHIRLVGSCGGRCTTDISKRGGVDAGS